VAELSLENHELAEPPGALVAELMLTNSIPLPPPRVPVGLPSDLLQRRPDIQRGERQLSAFAKEQTRYQSLGESVRAQQVALNLARDLYQNGLTDFIRVLNSERSLYQAEDALVQSQASVSENPVSLDKALGGGWQSAGSETNPPLPSSNQNRTGTPQSAGVTVSESE
jgi:outer membrane protein TolC